MRVVVVGGGPSGIMAAGAAARGANVVLIEKNRFLGRKLMITGKGRCNITNACPAAELINNIPVNGRFMHSAFSVFGSGELRDFLLELGIKTKVERGRRVFPESEKAGDIVAALTRNLEKQGVSIYRGAAARIDIKDGRARGVFTARGGRIAADAVIIATGGLSYPVCGSTGDGYKFARAAGHTIIAPKPSLVPLVADEGWVGELMGLSLKNITAAFFEGDKKLFSQLGELVFTHFGVSGPLALSASAHINGRCRAVIDLKPGLSPAELDQRLLRDFAEKPRKQFSNALEALLPKKMIPVFVRLSKIGGERQVSTITKNERRAMVSLLKEFSFTITGKRPISEAIVTSGGVKVSEVNPKTMESKKVRGLYFAGEVLDVDGYTGGFNLQIAFSSGYLAGINAVKIKE